MPTRHYIKATVLFCVEGCDLYRNEAVEALKGVNDLDFLHLDEGFNGLPVSLERAEILSVETHSEPDPNANAKTL